MAKLTAEVYRSGETVSHWNAETKQVRIDSLRGDPSKLDISFKLASKGGGVTDVSLRIGKVGFDALLNQMWKVDPDWVTKLMVRQLYGHFWPE